MSETAKALDIKSIEDDGHRWPSIVIQAVGEGFGSGSLDADVALEIKQVEANERTGADINYPGREQGFDDCSLDRDAESALVG